MKRLLLTLVAALAVGASSCRTPTGAADVSDPAAKARLEALLHGRRDLDLKYVSVDVNAGVATLSGIVPNDEQLRLIHRLAASVRGVNQVLNNLVIQE